MLVKSPASGENKPKQSFDWRSQLSKIPRPNGKKLLHKHFPILDWLPKYNLEDGVSDLIAGITVGLTIIPQGIAYALVASLPAQVRHKVTHQNGTIQ